MDKLKQWVALSVVAALAIAAGGWFLLIGPKRAEAADLRAQEQQKAGENAQLATQLDVLRAQAKELPAEQAKLAAVAAKIPGDPGLPALVRALLDASTASGAELVSITPSAPQVVAAPVAAAPAAAAPAAPAQGQAGPTAPAPTPPSAGAPAAGATPPAGPAGSLASIPVKLEVFGDYFELQQFVSELEDLPRALRVIGLSVSPGSSPTQKETAVDEDGRSLTGSVDALVFMAAQRPAALTATVPGAESAPADAAANAAATTQPAG